MKLENLYNFFKTKAMKSKKTTTKNKTKKHTQWAHALKNYPYTCNCEIFNSFNPELQQKKILNLQLKLTNEFVGWTKSGQICYDFDLKIEKLKSRSSYSWLRHCHCTKIDVYYNHKKYKKISCRRLRVDYWFSNKTKH